MIKVIESRFRFAHFAGYFFEVYYLGDKSTKVIWTTYEAADTEENHRKALEAFVQKNKLIGRCAFSYREGWRKRYHLFEPGDGKVDPWIFYMDCGAAGVVQIPLQQAPIENGNSDDI